MSVLFSDADFSTNEPSYVTNTAVRTYGLLLKVSTSQLAMSVSFTLPDELSHVSTDDPSGAVTATVNYDPFDAGVTWELSPSGNSYGHITVIDKNNAIYTPPSLEEYELLIDTSTYLGARSVSDPTKIRRRYISIAYTGEGGEP